MDLDFETLSLLKKDFGLTENHLMVLRFLFDNREGVSAEDIWSSTKVPKGRVYEFISDLIDVGLLSVEYSRPKKYFLKQPSAGLRDALRLKELDFLNLSKKVARVGSRLDHSWGGSKEPLMKFFSQQSDDATVLTIDFFVKAASIRSSFPNPSFVKGLGSDSNKPYLKIHALVERLNDPAFSVKFLFVEETMEAWFLKEGNPEFINRLRDFVDRDNVEVRLISSQDFGLPSFRGMVSDKAVMFTFAQQEGSDLGRVYVESGDLASSVSAVFDANFRQGKPLT
ncbi:MAG: TrmB family transcriptional regulator, partial [Candidatus Diapherotrites archaeon]|nr:TrmB family transcriptional regulator [Candidatus Diapherotrites archaeon]